MKHIASIILLAALTAATASARIGETAAEIENRYGKPGPSVGTDELGHQTSQYLFSGYKIIVTFVGGKSEREKYSKEDESRLWTDDINSLLTMNVTNGATWKNTVSGKWKSSDDKLLAYFVDGILDVTTNDYRKALKAADEKSQEDNVFKSVKKLGDLLRHTRAAPLRVTKTSVAHGGAVGVCRWAVPDRAAARSPSSPTSDEGSATNP